MKYKARLIAKGCAQHLGHNYLETHSPVMCLETIRAILAIAPTCKLHIQQMDVKGAYLNRMLKEHIYMQQPEGFADGTSQVCLLVKTLYGLKQARREWNIKLNGTSNLIRNSENKATLAYIPTRTHIYGTLAKSLLSSQFGLIIYSCLQR